MTGGRARVRPAPRAGSAPSPAPSPGSPPSAWGVRTPGGRRAHVLTAAAKAPRRPPPRPARLTRAASRAGAASGDHRAKTPSSPRQAPPVERCSLSRGAPGVLPTPEAEGGSGERRHLPAARPGPPVSARPGVEEGGEQGRRPPARHAPA